jgi:4-hydroxymandelate oxidase
MATDVWSPLVSVSDARERARAVIEPPMWSVLYGDHGDIHYSLGRTDEANERSWDLFELVPRMMVDVSKRKLSTTVLGQELSMPIALAPVGGQLRFHPEGEAGASAGAKEAGTLMCVSMVASATLEDIAKSGVTRWAQLYVMDDPKVTEQLIRRAEDAGYGAIVLTVDIGHGLSSARSDHSWLDAEPQFPMFRGLDIADPITADNFRERKSLSFTWEGLKQVRKLTTLPIVLKGLASTADARLAVEAGVNAVVVSNHGGHSLESVEGIAPRLPEIAAAVGKDIEVYVDGGVRRGVDVLKALALGARAVLIGRAQTWGLAAGGAAGVAGVLEVLAGELKMAMGWAGVTDVESVPAELVHRLGAPAVAAATG